MLGFGSSHFDIAIYIENRPPLEDYSAIRALQPLRPGEIQSISQQTGNHWRKVFNVSAKFLFELRMHDKTQCCQEESWQTFRELSLFQQHGKEALLFSPPSLNKNNNVHIVAGKTYAKKLGLDNLVWLDEYFAVNEAARLVVCPYLDYRQLSNARISQLVDIVKKLSIRVN